MGLKLDPFLLRPRVGLLEKGRGTYILCDVGAQSWPVPSAPVLLLHLAKGPGWTVLGAGSWLPGKGGFQVQGFCGQVGQVREAWLGHQPTV